jgi:hypothetical protein
VVKIKNNENKMIEYGLIIIPMEGKNAPPRPMNPIIDE